MKFEKGHSEMAIFEKFFKNKNKSKEQTIVETLTNLTKSELIKWKKITSVDYFDYNKSGYKHIASLNGNTIVINDRKMCINCGTKKETIIEDKWEGQTYVTSLNRLIESIVKEEGFSYFLQDISKDQELKC